MRWLVLAAAVLGACSSRVQGVTCEGDGDCQVSGVRGTCEATGYCSYPDPACLGGRYSPAAGDGLGNTCVGGPAPCGEQDQPCCRDGLCGADLACDGPTTTCVCGGDGQPCCGGATCDANLACDGLTLCQCGGVGQPCCDGSGCNAGLACAVGKCSGSVLGVAVGMGHVCALMSDHTVACWGSAWRRTGGGVAGLGLPINFGLTPTLVASLTAVDDLRSGDFHTCARKTDRTLWCWGHNEGGQLGNGTFVSARFPVKVEGLSNVTLFDAGRHHTCAVGTYSESQALWCWGHGNVGGHDDAADPTLGRLGNGDIVDSAVPVRVDLSGAAAAGQTIRSLSAGAYHSCIAMSDKRVWCWGANDTGQLGNSTNNHSRVPVLVNLAGVAIAPTTTIDEVSVSDSARDGSSCLRLNTGKVHCWGNAGDGQLGDGTVVARTAPTTAVTTTATVVAIASGKSSHCGRTSTGELLCWGRNKAGVLGNDTENNATVPVQVLDLSPIIHHSMSHRTACAVDGVGQLFCWGNDRRGQVSAKMSTTNGNVLRPELVVFP